MRKVRLVLLGIGLMGIVFAAPIVAATAERTGVVPVFIRIPKVGIEAQVAPAQIVDGVAEDPKCPWVVYWFEATGRLGVPGNAVMVGALDWWDVGPSVFYNLYKVKKDDEIDVVGDDDKVYHFEVSAVKRYERATAPVGEIFGPTETDKKLTLITGAGAFDYSAGIYLDVLVVTADRTSERARQQATPVATPGAAAVDATTDPHCLNP